LRSYFSFNELSVIFEKNTKIYSDNENSTKEETKNRNFALEIVGQINKMPRKERERIVNMLQYDNKQTGGLKN